MRLAWFSPLAPVRSGIASYSAMVLQVLAARHDIALFVGDDVWAARRSDARVGTDGFAAVASPWGPVRSAYDFAPIHRAQPFDLVVYQLGNAGCHDHMWAYLTRYPGLVVLHEAQLHQSRAHALIARGRADDLRAELRFGHPDAPAGVAEWILAGLGNPGAPIWPLTAVPLAAARAVAVHFPALAADLREAWPGLDVHVIRHGSPDLQRFGGGRGRPSEAASAARASPGSPAQMPRKRPILPLVLPMLLPMVFPNLSKTFHFLPARR